MTNREMLELAAKAAGHKLRFSNEWYEVGEPQIEVTRGRCVEWVYWNPLTDDGDALRLAVKLYLWEAIRLAHREVSDTVDIYAATRRAITRAAAEAQKEPK